MRRIAGLSGKIAVSAFLVFGIGTWWTAPAAAELYKYRKDGVWHFTDSPPVDMPAGRQTMAEIGANAPAPPPEGTPLLADFPARNAIEQAARATVAVKSAWGFGSGFFITQQGHIITNRHVVRSTEKQGRETDSNFRQVEGRIAELDRRFADERRRMQSFKSRLDHLASAARAERQPERRKALGGDYQANLRHYEDWRADYSRRLRAYEKERDTFRENRRNYEYSRSVADLAQTFTIILADDTELYARLIHISSGHDLALLKLDGYRTPALTPGGAHLAQSDPVYAIGNPVKLQNSVTSGVFSGFENGFLQTNAQIYPGNSGGPLVSAQGRVLGINTFKTLTRKFEGLGFAIPIQTALREFSAYLPQ